MAFIKIRKNEIKERRMIRKLVVYDGLKQTWEVGEEGIKEIIMLGESMTGEWTKFGIWHSGGGYDIEITKNFRVYSGEEARKTETIQELGFQACSSFEWMMKNKVNELIRSYNAGIKEEK